MKLWVQRRRNKQKKVERKNRMYSQPPLMDRHNRGELREEGEKTEERKEEREKDLVGLQ